MALERWLVSDTTSQCSTDTVNHPCYGTLQDAVTQAVAGDSIRILPGTYPANVTITKNITLHGDETARTFLTGGGSAAISVSGVTALMNIQNLTFIDAAPGILVSNASSQINIENNIFEVGSSATAIQVSDTSNPLIMNNTFYQNGTAIQSAQSSLSIVNNIFSGNALAISSNVVISNILNNLFFSNTAIGPTGIVFDSGDTINYKGNIQDSDPLFVDPTEGDISKRDFHLKTGTPCQDKGNTSAGADSIDSTTADIGAYGGAKSDTIPFPVQNLVSAGTSTVQLTWSANSAYQVTGYTVHYGTLSTSLTTSIEVGNVTTHDVPGLSPASAPTGTVQLSNSIANETLQLSWAPGATDATGYEIRYDQDGATVGNACPYTTTPTAGSSTIDAQNTLTYPLTGLANNTCYSVVVVPYALSTYYFAVTAHYATITFQSDNSNIVSQQIGAKAYGADSNVIHDFPEAISPHPDLPNKGCFIATAAYGYYSAPQVQALRAFRDEFLETNTAGRAFVRWYYRYGPIGAEFINVHAWLKPVVRTALLPAVGVALFMTRTSMLTKAAVLILVGILAGYLMRRRMRVSSGGVR